MTSYTWNFQNFTCVFTILVKFDICLQPLLKRKRTWATAKLANNMSPSQSHGLQDTGPSFLWKKKKNKKKKNETNQKVNSRQLAQLDKGRPAEREAVGSNPGQTNTVLRVFK